MDFKVGDNAVYPSQGVAEVVGIEQKVISDKPQRFYVLRILDSDMRILVPIDRAAQVGLRSVIGQDEIDDLMEILRDKEVRVDKQTWNRRYRGFMEKIKTGSLFEVAEVYRDLYRLKTTKTLSFGERRMLDTAKSLIVKELSIARRTPEAKVERELESLVSN
jgi:CarD family transcriptional regulator